MANFNSVPTIHAPRSKFDLSYGVKTTTSVGRLIPVMVQEIYPGDSFKVDSTVVARLSSSYIRPVMDNLFCDMYYFFVPSRLVYDKWEQIFGENRKSAWAQPSEVVAPTFADRITVEEKTVWDYLGLPLGELPSGVNVLPARAFAKIYDDWFRDENLIDPMFINTGDFSLEEFPNNSSWTPNNYSGKCPNVAKFHDVFTSALPNTQKSLQPVNIPLSGFVPLTAGTQLNDLLNPWRIGTNQFGNDMQLVGIGEASPSGNKTVAGKAITSGGTIYDINSTNLGVNLDNVGGLNVTDLRYAFQLQRILERAARSGSRYTEYIYSAFNVKSPDARLQRSEYLGGKRFPISVQQVAQTTRGDEDYTELGQLGAFSLTNSKLGYTKSFVEHGFVISVACLRSYHSYQQGIEKFFHRSDRFSYYDPALAFLSEQPIYKSELYAKGQAELKQNIFGYQEAWYDLRTRNNLITGEMRSDAENSLDIWHYGDDYASEPFLNQTFIEETPINVDRTIAVPSTSLDQFILDIWHNQSAVRRLPLYSVPGLIDHY